MKTSNLKWHALDWAVHVAMHGKCEGYPEHHYSADWAHGGPIIEREKIELFIRDEKWFAYSSNSTPEDFYGETPLIAAMRCYVASVLGDEIEIPSPLKS
jgi:hypothetical protein